MFSKETPSDNPGYYDDLARKETDKGNHKKAIVYLKKALGIRGSVSSEDDIMLIRNHHDLGVAYRLKGDMPQAATELEKTVQLCNRYHPEEAGLISESLLHLAYVNMEMKKNDAAEDCLIRCLKLRKTAKERNPRELAEVYEAYSTLCAIAGNQHKRWEYADLRVVEAKKVVPTDEPLIIAALFQRAKAEYNHGLFEECEITLLECQVRLYSAPDKRMEKDVSDSLRVIDKKIRNKDKKGFF